RKISEPNIVCKLFVSCAANKCVLSFFATAKCQNPFGIEITSPGVKRKDSHSLSLGFIKPISASPSIQYVSSDAFGWNGIPHYFPVPNKYPKNKYFQSYLIRSHQLHQYNFFHLSQTLNCHSY